MRIAALLRRRRLRPVLRLLPLWLLLLGARPVAAQLPDQLQLAVSDTLYEVRLADGSVLFGRIVSAEPLRIVLLTQGGVRVEVDRGQIRSASPARGTVRPDGSVWIADPNSTRLFFGPTGRALGAGEAYLGAFELFLPFIAVGLTDRITIAGGTPIFPEVIGRVIYLAPRIQIVRAERAHLSTGVLAFFDLTDSTDDTVLGILFGAGTFGSVDNALTVGAGWGFAGSDIENRPAFLIGAETRVSARVKLITENYVVSYVEQIGPAQEETRRFGLIGAGVRIFGERLAGDLGLGFGVGEDDFGCCIPLVNFVYNFGSR